MSYAVERPDPKGWRCSCLKRHCLLVSRQIHRYFRTAKSPFAHVHQANYQVIAAKGRLETIKAGNRQDNKKKNEEEDEWNGVGGSWGPEGGPGRIVIGVTCIRRGPLMTIKRWGRCMSLRKVRPYLQYCSRIKPRRVTVYSEAEAHTQRSLIMCRRNGNFPALLTNFLLKRLCVSRVCDRTKQYSSSTSRKRLIIA